MIEANAVIGIMLGMIVGAFCRWFDLPLPAPPTFIGALLVLAITLGYLTGNMIGAL